MPGKNSSSPPGNTKQKEQKSVSIEQIPFTHPGQVEREPQWWYDTVNLIEDEETLLEILCGKSLEQQLHNLCRRARLHPEEVLLIALRSKLLEAGVSLQGDWLLPLARNIAATATQTRADNTLGGGRQ